MDKVFSYMSYGNIYLFGNHNGQELWFNLKNNSTNIPEEDLNRFYININLSIDKETSYMSLKDVIEINDEINEGE